MPRITVTVPDQVSQPYRFSLERQIVHFGRGDDNDVHIDSGSVSSEHCVMERIIGGYVLKDLGSTNGIKLNGERVDKISLRNGQDIQLGDVDFTFQLSDEEMTALRLEDPASSLPPLDEPPIEKTPVSEPEPKPMAEAKPEPPPAPPEPRQEQPRPKPEPLPEIREESGPPAEAPIQAAPNQSPASSHSEEDSGKFNKLIALLAAVAFVVGIAMHFERSTGQSMIQSIMKKVSGDEGGK